MKLTHSFHIQKPLFHELRSEWVSERASERMSAAERASEASSAEQANEWAVRANERTEERMAQYSTRRFHSHWTQCGTRLVSRLLAPLTHSLAPHCTLCLRAPLRSFFRSLTHSGAHGIEISVYELNTSISYSSNPLCIRHLRWLSMAKRNDQVTRLSVEHRSLVCLLTHFTHSRARGTVNY